MKRNIGRSTTRGLFICCFVFLAGVALARPKNTTVRVGLLYDPSTINILEFKTGGDLPAIMPMHQSLLGVNPKTGRQTVDVPLCLSESITVMKNRKDIKITLKKGQRFHSGDPVTTADVEFTWEGFTDPANANIAAALLDEVEEFELVDDRTFILRFYEPYAAWRELLTIGIASKKYFEKAGRKKFRTHPVGSGPFRFVKRAIGSYVELEAVGRKMNQDATSNI